LPEFNVIVENAGVPSYVREQEAIWYEIKLLDERKPDLVIFYDGANDAIFCGWMRLRHRELERFVKAMQGDEVTLKSLASGFFYRFTNTGVLLDLTGRVPKVEAESPNEEIDERARSAAQRYVQLADRCRELTKAEGRKIALFLQPTLYLRPR